MMGHGLEEEELKNKMELVKIHGHIKQFRIHIRYCLARSEKAEGYIWPFEVDIMEPSGKNRLLRYVPV
ncbi:unnamed protein product [Brassica oleracea var. botrytis]|uniref:Uncharacterized protein n=1 Tax=Brassica oleracea TaxID=3712 RepID=A0A3P6DI74_BRAOL|nr:unnamed protein product [Brassica oleracea]